MKLPGKTLLLLNDQRIGNYKQLKAISYYLKSDFIIKESKLEFNFFSKLPNFLQWPRSVAITNRNKILSIQENPDVILSCGRRSAPFARYLKSKFPESKLVHLLKPNICTKKIDLLITPKHDNYIHANYEYLLPPSLVSLDTFAKTSQGFEYLKAINDPKLCVIIGGSSKNKKLGNTEYKNFIDLMEFLNGVQNQKILLTTSRRTDQALLDIINESCLKNKNIEAYLYRDNDSLNPYSSFLYYADKILVTGDSISMVADSILTKKPVMVYDDFAGPKQLEFLSNLYANNLALKFTDKVTKADFKGLVKYEGNDAKDIAQAIKDLIV